MELSHPRFLKQPLESKHSSLTEHESDLLIYSCLYLIHIVLNNIVMHLGACIDTNVLESFA